MTRGGFSGRRNVGDRERGEPGVRYCAKIVNLNDTFAKAGKREEPLSLLIEF